MGSSFFPKKDGPVPQPLTKFPSFCIIVRCLDPLAQLAEHLTFNQGVRGSNPRWVTSSSQASSRSRRAFSFYCKAHRALILLLLPSKPNPLRWALVWGRRCPVDLTGLEQAPFEPCLPSGPLNRLFLRSVFWVPTAACDRLPRRSLLLLYFPCVSGRNEPPRLGAGPAIPRTG